jgi:hypothetical protein
MFVEDLTGEMLRIFCGFMVIGVDDQRVSQSPRAGARGQGVQVD